MNMCSLIHKMILHLDVDAFFASVEQSHNPLLMGRPLIVGGLPYERGCVHTASYEARRAGVYTGMSLRQAQEICPKAVFLKGDYRRYRAAGKKIEEILRRYSPIVELASLDDAYVDISGCVRVHENTETIMLKIKNDIRADLNIGVSMGVASSKLIARIASGINKPEGITIVQPGNEREFLNPLPLIKLRGVGRKTELLFRDLGITRVEQLSKLDRAAAHQLLGPVIGETLWQYARGNDKRVVESKKEPKQISRETSFEKDTDDEKFVAATLQYLTDRIATKLREFDCSTRKILLRIRYSDGKSQKQWTSLRYRTSDGATLSQEVLKTYESLPGRRVRIKLVGVTVSDIRPDDQQGTMFSKIERENNLNQSIDNVRTRYGFTSLAAGTSLYLKDHYRMEKHGFILHTPALSQ